MIEEPVVARDDHVPAEVRRAGDDGLRGAARRRIIKQEYIWGDRLTLHYRLPLAEIVVDYFDALKSATRGYATLDYEMDGYSAEKLVKVELLINGDPVDALAIICHQDNAESRGRSIAKRLKEDRSPGSSSRCASRPRSAAAFVASTRIAPLRRERHREVLRRRRHPQAQAARAPEGRQAPHEGRGERRGPAGGLHVHPEAQ
jgi:GTP-binding protein LepA